MNRAERTRRLLAAGALAAMCACTACATDASEMKTSDRPELETDFGVLYGTNCAACHGADGRGGAAPALNDALYLALVGDARLRQVIGNGEAGTPMLPFAQAAGGTLTGDQIGVLVGEMRRRWGGPQFAGMTLPAYSAEEAIARGEAAGDPDRGAAAQQVFCASCHGGDGRGGRSAGSIVDRAYLSLTSNQALRTAVLTAHVDGVTPAWREPVSAGDGGSKGSRVMSAQEISDVVAWLASQRGRHD